MSKIISSGRNLADDYGTYLKIGFALADEFGDCVEARENGLKVDPYVLKNQTIEFANAIRARGQA